MHASVELMGRVLGRVALPAAYNAGQRVDLQLEKASDFSIAALYPYLDELVTAPLLGRAPSPSHGFWLVIGPQRIGRVAALSDKERPFADEDYVVTVEFLTSGPPTE
jgi:hypothetical protein